MMLGTVFCNFSEYSVDIMNRSSKWTSPLYALFFVLSGAELDLGVFRYPAIVLIGVVYILMRCLGKYYGARLSSSLMHCNETNIILFSVLVYELAGPQLTRIALTKAGEIKAGADDAKNRARFEKKAKIA